MKLSRKEWLMLAVLVFGAFITVLNQTLVTPALPSIMVDWPSTSPRPNDSPRESPW